LANIETAHHELRRTRLAISLSPLPECIRTLDRTVDWFRARGITTLTMSPTLYDRAGTLRSIQMDSSELKTVIRRYGFARQDLDFIPGVGDIISQWRANRHKCIPRNSDILISSAGEYMYCFNDISHSRTLASVADASLRDALEMRERMSVDDSICNACNLRERYGPSEVVGAAVAYAKRRLEQMLHQT
jgi:hypothetical protein